MKKIYEQVQFSVVVFHEDVISTSDGQEQQQVFQTDNVVTWFGK